MRKLSITKKRKTEVAPLKNVPENLLWIEKIALEFARTNSELKKLYRCGLKAYLKHAESNGKEKHNVYVVRQAILNLLNEAL